VTVQCSLIVRNLGVTLDGQLSMDDHVTAISRSCFHQLRQLRAVRKSLTPEALRTLVQSFISNRLVLLWHSGRHHRSADAEAAGCPECRCTPDCRRQKVRSRQSYTVRPTVRQRITFKLCVLAYKYLHGMARPYLSEFHVPTSSQASRPRLRSSSTNSLLVPRAHATETGTSL